MWVVYVLGFILAVRPSTWPTCRFTVPACRSGRLRHLRHRHARRYVTGLGKVLATRSPGLPAPRSWPKPPADGDPAVLQYFYGPAVADADHAVRVATATAGSCGNSASRWSETSFTRDDAAWFTGPLGVGGAIGMAVGTCRSGRSSRPSSPSSICWSSASRPRWCARRGCAAWRRLGHAPGEERQDGVPALLRAGALSRL